MGKTPDVIKIVAPLTLQQFAELQGVNAVVEGDSIEAQADNELLRRAFSAAADLYSQLPNPDRNAREKFAFALQASGTGGSLDVLGMDLAESSAIGRVIQFRALLGHSYAYHHRADVGITDDTPSLAQVLLDHLESLPAFEDREKDVLVAVYRLMLDLFRRDFAPGSNPVDVRSKAMSLIRDRAPEWGDVMVLLAYLCDWPKIREEMHLARISRAASALDLDKSPLIAPVFNAADRVKNVTLARRAVKALCRRYPSDEQLIPTVVCAAIQMDNLDFLAELPKQAAEAARQYPSVRLVAAIDAGDAEMARAALQEMGWVLNLDLATLRESYLSRFGFRDFGQDAWPVPDRFIEERAERLLPLLPPGEFRSNLAKSACMLFGSTPGLAPHLVAAFDAEPDFLTLLALLEQKVVGQAGQEQVAQAVALVFEEDIGCPPFDEENVEQLSSLNLEPYLEAEVRKRPRDQQDKLRGELLSVGLLHAYDGGAEPAPARTSRHAFDFQRGLVGGALPENLRGNLVKLRDAVPTLDPESLIYLQAALGQLIDAAAASTSINAGVEAVVDAVDQVLALNQQELNEVGTGRVTQLTKRYGAPALLRGLDELAKQPETTADGGILDGLSKLMVTKQGGLQPRRAYLAGVLRKRLPNMKGAWLDQQVAACLKRGVDIEQMIDLAKNVTSWGEWEEGLDSLRPY